MVRSRMNDTIDSHSESSTNVSNYVSIIESDSMNSRHEFKLKQEFYEYMGEDELFNLDNYMDRD